MGSPAYQRPQPANLGDILERVLDKGIVIAGDIRVNPLDIELLTIKLRLVIASLDTAWPGSARPRPARSWPQGSRRSWGMSAIVNSMRSRCRATSRTWTGSPGQCRRTTAVLAAVAGRGPVVPTRPATLFSSDAGVTGTLQERADDYRGALNLISTRSEWVVKAADARA